MCPEALTIHIISSVLVYSLPYGGPVAMVWGVRIFFTQVAPATDFHTVARLQHFLNDDRVMYRRAGISSSNIRWTVLLDIQVFV